jgi:hypothetical protein
MKRTTKVQEERRFEIQGELDARKTSAERNRLGQFATPPALAHEILEYARMLLPKTGRVSFFDPALGTGAFFSAFRDVFPKQRRGRCLGFEIDPHYGEPALALWKKSELSLKLEDFTRATPNRHYNLVICNPPYVRHHHLVNGEKPRLQLASQLSSGMRLSGLAGLYCHFLGLSHSWMAPGGIAGWLIPSEFMDVNYGQAVKRYLLERVTLLHVHRFDPNDVQFADALVSSAVVWFRNSPPPRGHDVKFTFGGSLLHPRVTRSVASSELARELKWTRFPLAAPRGESDKPTLSDFFQIKRGLATGDNDYFILSAAEIVERQLPLEAFRPILPSPRYMPLNEVAADRNGLPLLERQLFLLDTDLSETEIGRRWPSLLAYLEEGKKRGLDQRYLCRHRALWYAQEKRPAPPIACTYMGRSDKAGERPFRFILNTSKATVANVYLAMYPTQLLASALARDPSLLRRVWQILNTIAPQDLLGEGRVYGGGLHKLEPRELANVPVPEIAALLPPANRPARQIAFSTDLSFYIDA